jgi:hypothetical protein
MKYIIFITFYLSLTISKKERKKYILLWLSLLLKKVKI